MQTEKQSISKILSYSDLGFVDYKEAWNLQKEIFQKRLANSINDTLLLLEHPHTYTFGKSADKENLLLSDAE